MDNNKNLKAHMEITKRTGQMIQKVIWLLGEKKVGDAGKHSSGPAESRDEGGPGQVLEGEQVDRQLPGQVWEGEQVEGVADRQVALHGEGDDGEDARIGGAEVKSCFSCFFQEGQPTFQRGNFSSYRICCQMARDTDANTTITRWGGLQ